MTDASRPATRGLEPSAVELVEEAVHLLRRAPVGTLAIYYVGSVPYVLALLYFWAHIGWFQPTGDWIAWGALGLVALFVAMKGLHAEFCRRLLAQRLGTPPPAWSWARLGRSALAQARLQSWALPVLLLAVVLTIPVGWVYAYAQNLCALDDDERPHSAALAQAELWPGQNHLGLLILAAVALAVAVNFAMAFFAVPWLANRLLGLENIFGFSGMWFFNTTFLASVVALTWLAVDPLVKAFYLLRVFHGRARRTGEDLRVELQLARRARTVAARVAVVALLLVATPWPRVQAAEPATPAPRAVEPAQLDRAIDEVLAGQDFRWRLRPKPGAVPADEGPVARFMRQGLEIVKEMGRSVKRTLGRIADWFEETFFRGKSRRPTSEATDAAGVATAALYFFIALAVALVVWVAWLVARSARAHAAPLLAARAVAAQAPDLRDESIQAAQLPVDGWLALAREQMQRGEWRLALRALYLAMLARYAAEGLVSLAKHKTNLDYEREVRRRALSRSERAVQFAARRREFEGVWYGRDQPGEPQVRAWLADLERAT